MKLGISYGAFDGTELLEYTIRNMRKEVDFICLVRQRMSYHGNPADPFDLENVEWLLKSGLADEVVDYDPDLSLHPQVNETRIRNLGRERSAAAGCTHHTSADVDEFYVVEQLRAAKEGIGDYEWSMAQSVDYFKRPTWKVVPERRHLMSFIHPVGVSYGMNMGFKFGGDYTRRPAGDAKCLLYDPGEFVLHHMNYVRNDMRKKAANNMNHKRPGTQNQFYAMFDKYQLGDSLRIPPDHMYRKTVEVPNLFNIKESNGRIVSDRA